MTVLELTDASFDEVVLACDSPVLVDFTAGWCPPCRMMDPVLEQLASDSQGRLVVARLEVDSNPGATARHRVMAMPTFALFVAGQERRRLVGARGKAQLLRELAEALDSDRVATVVSREPGRPRPSSEVGRSPSQVQSERPTRML